MGGGREKGEHRCPPWQASSAFCSLQSLLFLPEMHIPTENLNHFLIWQQGLGVINNHPVLLWCQHKWGIESCPGWEKKWRGREETEEGIDLPSCSSLAGVNPSLCWPQPKISALFPLLTSPHLLILLPARISGIDVEQGKELVAHLGRDTVPKLPSRLALASVSEPIPIPPVSHIGPQWRCSGLLLFGSVVYLYLRDSGLTRPDRKHSQPVARGVGGAGEASTCGPFPAH